MIFSLDLDGEGLLPQGWKEQVCAASKAFGKDTVLTGDGTTSREAGPVNIEVRVVEGDSIFQHLPWLYELYSSRLLRFCSDVFGNRLFVAERLRSSVNINHLSGRGARYEWHVDSNPVTGVLFATDTVPGLGGSLVFALPNGGRRFIRQRAGVFICFDGRVVPHRVAPLRQTGDRISIPMNYYETPTHQERPSELDALLYERTK